MRGGNLGLKCHFRTSFPAFYYFYFYLFLFLSRLPLILRKFEDYDHEIKTARPNIVDYGQPVPSNKPNHAQHSRLSQNVVQSVLQLSSLTLCKKWPEKQCAALLANSS